jgi:hypothetical protein
MIAYNFGVLVSVQGVLQRFMRRFSTGTSNFAGTGASKRCLFCNLICTSNGAGKTCRSRKPICETRQCEGLSDQPFFRAHLVFARRLLLTVWHQPVAERGVGR